MRARVYLARVLIGGVLILAGTRTDLARAMKPLSTIETFLHGRFAVPSAPPRQDKALPPEIAALPHDTSPLPEGAWLRFQSIGRGRFAGYGVTLLVDSKGNAFQVLEQGGATPASLSRPALPARPSVVFEKQILDKLRADLLPIKTGPAYTGHPGVNDAPVFFLTERSGPAVKEAVYEAAFPAGIEYLRVLTSYVLSQEKAAERPRKPR